MCVCVHDRYEEREVKDKEKERAEERRPEEQRYSNLYLKDSTQPGCF